MMPEPFHHSLKREVRETEGLGHDVGPLPGFGGNPMGVRPMPSPRWNWKLTKKEIHVEAPSSAEPGCWRLRMGSRRVP